MAQTKEIKKKIGSVPNTKKITSAMELVASSKMKKTQDAMKKGKPYSQKIVELIDNLAGASSACVSMDIIEIYFDAILLSFVGIVI